MIKAKLQKSSIVTLAVYASLFIFLLYTCAYAYRKPFTVGLYSEELWGINVKILYVLAEILGYALSKFIGVRVLPSMQPRHRIYYVISLISISELALLGFAFFSTPFKIISIFFSGLPLGMIWGIIFSYIEGRRISEVLNVGLSVALIVSSGLVKTLGRAVMDYLHVSEYWMPFVTGAICFPFMLGCIWMLNQIPAPDEKDIIQRTKRVPMSSQDKKMFYSKFAFGICMLIVFYASLTVFREIRDSFAADIWQELEIKGAFVFTQTEIPIAFFVLLLMFLIVFIRNNQLALKVIYVIAVIGGLLMIVSTCLYSYNKINPIFWMILSGLGMYMGYIPFTYLVERLIASLKIMSTAVFIIYLADSFGYLGTAVVFFMKNFVSADISWTSVLVYVAFISGLVSIISILMVYRYFRGQLEILSVSPKTLSYD